ncbi:hypothetical protein CEXT_476891 [Caerostris extrusa]|uniref:Uncharacterized protein n=1 Tax=Caerostris extrusa TaxID=172846 RepID=A0AAV4P831_CAEEX|nr:hypothetical protein CEXT_476891 [Caerostris extrusa]
MTHVWLLLKLELPTVDDCLCLFGRGNRCAVGVRFERWDVCLCFSHGSNFAPKLFGGIAERNSEVFPGVVFVVSGPVVEKSFELGTSQDHEQRQIQ